MDKELVFDNKKYLSSRYAGKIFGYTNDYVTRLARQKKVFGKMVGRVWYVEEESFKNFIQNNTAQKNQLYEKLRKFKKIVSSFSLGISLQLKKSSKIFNSVFFKKGLAGTIAFSLVFGIYFYKDTDIAKAGFEKVSRVAILAINAVAKFDTKEFVVTTVFASKNFAEDATLNIYHGIKKTKPLAKIFFKKTYLFASGDKKTRIALKKNIKVLLEDIALYTDKNIASVILSARDFTKISLENVPLKIYSIARNKVDAVSSEIIYLASHNGSANVFASVFNKTANYLNETGSDIADSLSKNATFVYNKVNETVCETTTILCSKEKRANTAIVLSDEKNDIAQTEKEPFEESSLSEKLAEEQTPRTIINQPIIERVVQTEKILTVSGISREDMELAVQQLKNKVYSDMYNLTSSNEANIINNYSIIGQTNKIDKLGNVIISNSTIESTSIAGTNGTFSSALSANGGLYALFAEISNDLTVDTNTLYVDSVNNRVGIGTTTPSSKFQVLSSGGSQLRLNYDSLNFQDFTIDSTGALQIAQDGDSATLTLTNGNVGIGTTSPYTKLSVAGRGVVGWGSRADFFTATSTTQASTFAYASTTAITAITASTTDLIASAGVTFQNLLGILSSNGASGGSARTLAA